MQICGNIFCKITTIAVNKVEKYAELVHVEILQSEVRAQAPNDWKCQGTAKGNLAILNLRCSDRCVWEDSAQCRWWGFLATAIDNVVLSGGSLEDVLARANVERFENCDRCNNEPLARRHAFRSSLSWEACCDESCWTTLPAVRPRAIRAQVEPRSWAQPKTRLDQLEVGEVLT